MMVYVVTTWNDEDRGTGDVLAVCTTQQLARAAADKAAVEYQWGKQEWTQGGWSSQSEYLSAGFFITAVEVIGS